MGWFAVLVFAIAAALRLARFNVAIEDPDKRPWQDGFFTGMPAPAGACLALLPLYLSLSELQVPHDQRFAAWHIGYLLVIAFLMVSRIPHFSGKKLGRVPREYVVVVLFGVAVTLLLIATWPMEMLAACCLLYLGMIPFAIRRYRQLAAQDVPRAAT